MKFASSLLVMAAGAVSASIVPGQNFFDRRAGIQPPIQGDISFKIPGRNITAKTHFKAYGNYKNLLVTPLVVLHGGPGIPSNYLAPLADLAQWMPVIIYDQIGSGTSSHFPETIGDTSFWTEALFEAELKNLIKALGIENNFSLYGHSWGGMLGARFAATQPKGLKKLVLASSPATIPLWLKVANELRDKLPTKYRTALDKHEADGTTDDPEYLAAVQYFYDLHVVRIVPNPADVQASFAGLGEDPTVYLTMNGPNEFSIIGPLKDWSGLKYGPKIKVPTLLTNGKYDEGQDACIQPWYDLIPNVKWIKFPNSSHMAFWEERTSYIATLKKFLL